MEHHAPHSYPISANVQYGLENAPGVWHESTRAKGSIDNILDCLSRSFATAILLH
jgi:hypothetical protein